MLDDGKDAEDEKKVDEAEIKKRTQSTSFSFNGQASSYKATRFCWDKKTTNIIIFKINFILYVLIKIDNNPTILNLININQIKHKNIKFVL